MYRQGVARTTLADIAQAADVPVGNVYYYFKTKDDIIAAVVEAHQDRLRASFADLERRHSSPKARLRRSATRWQRSGRWSPGTAARTGR